MQGFVLQLELSPRTPKSPGRADGVILYAQAINLPRLHCLGSHAAPPTTSNVSGGHRVVFLMHGSYFAVRNADAPPETRHLYIHDQHVAAAAAAAAPSYDALLLTRLLRMHRAIKSQSDTNAHFKAELNRRGITDATHLQEAEAAAAGPETSRSLRQQVFSQLPKKPVTRLKELKLRAQVERLRLRNELYRNERERMRIELERTLRTIDDIRTKMNDTNVVLTNKVHTMSKDKVTFSRWEERLAANSAYVNSLQDVLHSCQLSVLHGFHFLFPIQNADEDSAAAAAASKTSIRWISLPRVEDARGKTTSEMMLGVSSGWVAEMLVIFSCVLNVPLRFPIRLGGSNSSIFDPSTAAAVGGNVFPLYLKGADATRAEYGVFILQKNLAQLRWACGLPSNNYKATLKNLYELIMLKDRRGTRLGAQDQFRLDYNALSPPPGAGAGADSGASRGAATASRARSPPRDSEAPDVRPAHLAPSSSSSSSSHSSSIGSSKDNPREASEKREENGVMPLLSPPLLPPPASSLGETTRLVSDTSSTPTPRLISSAGDDGAHALRKAGPPPAPGSATGGTGRSSPPPNSGNVGATSPAASSFWGDVQSRTQALSVTTSFQRRKHVSNQH